MEREANRGQSGVDIDGGLGGQVRSTVAQLYRRFRRERPEGALGDTALEVLTWLHKHGPHTLTALSEQGRVAPASMSASVNRLTAGGYAVRVSDPNDGRKIIVSTTPEGAELAVATQIQRKAWLDAQLGALSRDDQNAIARACALL